MEKYKKILDEKHKNRKIHVGEYNRVISEVKKQIKKLKKKAPKKLKKKLVLVEPEPDNRIKEALDKYKLHLSRIEGYVEDGSFEKGDEDYNDMIEEAEKKLMKNLKN